MKKLLAVSLALCMIFALCACGQKVPDREVAPISTAQPVIENAEQGEVIEVSDPVDQPLILPSATSEDVELYSQSEASGSYVVNKYGELAEDYQIDAKGNILDDQANYVVAADNVKEFYPIRALTFVKSLYEVKLVAREVATAEDPNITRVVQEAVAQKISLILRGDNATNHVIILESTDTNVAEIRANLNAKIIFDGNINLRNGQIAIVPEDPEKPVEITVTVKSAGDAKILAEALSGNAFAECQIHAIAGEVASIPVPTVTPNEYVNASGDVTMHIHHYRQSVIDPTPWAMGYTLYTCDECGHSYKDNYTSKLPGNEPEPTPHVHSYSSSIVAPSATERGFTLYVCSECGDSYKANFVDPTGSPAP